MRDVTESIVDACCRAPGVAAVLAVLASTPAMAEGSRLGDAGLTLDNQISVALSGQVPAHCQMGGGGDIDFGELRGDQTRSAALDLDCNLPFEITLTSTQGGLVHETRPGGQGPFAGALPYWVKITAPVLRPQRDVIEAEFISTELRSRRSIDSGDAIAAGGAQLRFRTARLPPDGMLAGAYSETLTLTVTARM